MTELPSEDKGIPIRELISSPLIACCHAQMLANKQTIDFIESLFDKNNQPKLLNFTVRRSLLGGDGEERDALSEIKAPLLGLVNVPSLKIDCVEIDFSMEITSASSVTEKKDHSLGIKFDNKLEENFEMRGKLSCSKKTIRTTDQSSKYFVKVRAKQDTPPEGLARVLDILSSSVGN